MERAFAAKCLVAKLNLTIFCAHLTAQKTRLFLAFLHHFHLQITWIDSVEAFGLKSLLFRTSESERLN